jgi:hypothetical protein
VLPPDGGNLNEEGVRILRTSLVSGGFQFIPGITGGKFTVKPYAGWRQSGEVFDPAVAYRGPYGALLNTALITAGLILLDLDIDTREDVAAVNTHMHATLGPTRCVRSRANSPRQLAMYRTDDATGLYACYKGEYGMIELFSGPLCKVTAFGLHTSKITGVRTRMEWAEVPGNVDLADLTVITLAQASAFLDSLDDVLGDVASRSSHVPGIRGKQSPDALRAYDPDEIPLAMACVPNTGRLSWEEWNRVGMMLYSASGGDDRGLLAFCEWSRKNPLSRHRDCFTRWDVYTNCPPTRIGAGSLFQLAYTNGYHRPATVLTPVRQPTARQSRASRRLTNFKPYKDII